MLVGFFNVCWYCGRIFDGSLSEWFGFVVSWVMLVSVEFLCDAAGLFKSGGVLVVMVVRESEVLGSLSVFGGVFLEVGGVLCWVGVWCRDQVFS